MYGYRLKRTTDILFGGRQVVVCGYGEVCFSATAVIIQYNADASKELFNKFALKCKRSCHLFRELVCYLII